MKAHIVAGAAVGQDFSFFRWPAENASVVFDVEFMTTPGTRVVCRADGFGSKAKYGCGAIYTDYENLDVVDFENTKPPRLSRGRTIIFDTGE